MMHIYQAADDRWIFFDGATKRYFDTEGEARHAMSKALFVQALQTAATELAQVADRIEQHLEIYDHRGYAPNGANPIVDAEIESLGLDVNLLNLVIGLNRQLLRFRDNQSVTSDNYGVTLSKIRNDI
jgi:hypothetical protein